MIRKRRRSLLEELHQQRQDEDNHLYSPKGKHDKNVDIYYKKILTTLTLIRVLQLYYTLNIMVAKQCTLAVKRTPMMATYVFATSRELDYVSAHRSMCKSQYINNFSKQSAYNVFRVLYFCLKT